jgi:hypothetical protein
MSIRFWCVLAGLLCGSGVAQAQIARLPDSACAALGEGGDGFEEEQPSWPSRGTGGGSGSGNAFVTVPGQAGNAAYANREYFWFVPDLPAPRSLPLVVTLHGTAGSPANARNEARIVRDLWRDAASEFGFAVLSPVAGGALGSWVAPEFAGDAPSDYDVIAAAMADFESHQDIERARRHLWGFSAGGHVALDLMLDPKHPFFSRSQFAAVAINAGALAGLACQGLAPAVCDLRLREAFPRLPLQVLVGNADPLRAHAAADAPRFLASGWVDQRNHRYLEFPGGHWVEPAHPAQHWDWLCRFARRLDPPQRFRLRPTTP